MGQGIVGRDPDLDRGISYSVAEFHHIRLGGPCNERLVPPSPPSPRRSLAEVRSDLRAARQAGARWVILTGGEPTLRKDLLHLVRLARSAGLGVGLATNGRTLIYPRLRQALISAGVGHFRVSLHAATAAIHDEMVGVPGAFAQTLAALRALLAEASPLQIELAYSLTPQNQDQPKALAALIATLPGPVKLVDVTPLGDMPNSFNFEHKQDLPGFTLSAGNCSARELYLGETSRRLLLEQGGEVSLYSTPTMDFTAEQVRQVKEETEQLYLDVSGSAALGELARQVRRLKVHAACAGCPQRPACCGAVSVRPGDPFAGEEAWIRLRLESLAGEVLDVGCGEQPYRELMGQKIRAGRVRYLGLDPDERALDRLRERGFPGKLEVGRVEALAGKEGAFDHVLALRTVNHVQDLPRALAVMSRALRPGGELLLSDMTVYGLLRTAGQVELADAQGHGQEHHHNLHGTEVLRLLADLPLELLEHRPVTRETSNEWFLWLRRLPDAEATR